VCRSAIALYLNVIKRDCNRSANKTNHQNYTPSFSSRVPPTRDNRLKQTLKCSRLLSGERSILAPILSIQDGGGGGIKRYMLLRRNSNICLQNLPDVLQMIPRFHVLSLLYFRRGGVGVKFDGAAGIVCITMEGI
jgi:hypothetical protein